MVTILPNMSFFDQTQAMSLHSDLKANFLELQSKTNIYPFVICYNSLYEKYKAFLTNQKIGFNFVVDLSINQFQIDAKAKQTFIEVYNRYHSSPDSPVVEYMKQVQTYNPMVKEMHTNCLKDAYLKVYHSLTKSM